jgi:hypothetical protein
LQVRDLGRGLLERGVSLGDLRAVGDLSKRRARPDPERTVAFHVA